MSDFAQSPAQYFKVMEEILRDPSRRHLVSEQDYEELKEYKASLGKQQTLAERLEKGQKQRELQHSLLTQMEDLEKFKTCTLMPQLATAKHKQIPGRSLQEFLIQQQAHL